MIHRGDRNWGRILDPVFGPLALNQKGAGRIQGPQSGPETRTAVSSEAMPEKSSFTEETQPAFYWNFSGVRKSP